MGNVKEKDKLSTFKKSQTAMVAINDRAYSSKYGINRYSETLKEYTAEDVDKILASGSSSALLNLSRTFFTKGGIYKRIVLHYATLLKYVGLLTPIVSSKQNVSSANIQKRYLQAMNFITNSNIPLLCQTWSQKALVDGVYYGLLISKSKEKFVLIDLPGSFCRTRYKDLEGRDIIEFKLSYFSTFIEEDERENVLAAFPKFFTTAYRKFKAGKIGEWLIIPADMGICFPFIDGRPFFVDIIPDIMIYDKVVDTELEGALDEIKKILVQKIPHLNDGTLLFEPEEATEMHDGAVGMTKNNKNFSVLTTYADVECISSNPRAETSKNTVEQMAQNIFNQAGITGQVFGATGSSSIPSSLTNDVSLMMSIANKYASFITWLLNSLFANKEVQFKYQFLPVTYHNEKDYVDSALKMANSGYSFLIPSIAMGVDQRDLVTIKDLENDVLNLKEKLIPLTTSYTQGAEDNQGGAPTKTGTQADDTVRKNENLDKKQEG